MIYNYRADKNADGTYSIVRYGNLRKDTVIGIVSSQAIANNTIYMLLRETTEMNTDSRTQTLNDIRLDFFLQLNELHCIEDCEKSEDVMITEVIKEVAELLKRRNHEHR